VEVEVNLRKLIHQQILLTVRQFHPTNDHYSVVQLPPPTLWHTLPSLDDADFMIHAFGHITLKSMKHGDISNDLRSQPGFQTKFVYIKIKSYTIPFILFKIRRMFRTDSH